MPVRSWIVGSLSECDIHVESPTVSGKHCRLTERGESFLLEDLQSTNGTFVDGQRIDGPRIVRRGDRVTLGQNVPLPWPAMPVAITVGRASDNDIVVPYDAVSGHHARVEREDGQTYLVDLGSTNGTAINDPLNKIARAPLAPTDFVFLGTHRIAAVDLLVAMPPERPKAKTLPEQSAGDATSAKQPSDLPSSQPGFTEPAPEWAASMRSLRSWLIGILGSFVVAALILGGARLRDSGEPEPGAAPATDSVDAPRGAPSASADPVSIPRAPSQSKAPSQDDPNSAAKSP